MIEGTGRRAKRSGVAAALTAVVSFSLPFFGVTGIAGAVAPFPAARGVAIDSSGRVVAVGRANNAFGVVRYNPDGSLDQSFGRGGRVLTHFGLGGWDAAYAVAIDRSGKIVVAGSSCCSASTRDFLLARYNPDGSRDRSFGTDGEVTTHVGSYDHARAVAIDSSGRIVVAGDDGHNFVLLRYRPNGRLDPTFGTGGTVTTKFDFGNSSAQAVAIEPSGRIIAGGLATTRDGSINAIALARYRTNGTLDPGFGNGGRVTSDFNPAAPGESSGANGLAVDASGRIIVAGGTTVESSGVLTGEFALARYNTDGSRDTTFGSGGEVATDLGDGAQATSVAIDPAGRIVVAGWGFTDAYRFDLARYQPDGSLDATFGNGGEAGISGGYTQALAIDPAGGIAIAGVLAYVSNSFGVARLTPAGAPDPGFGSGGVVGIGFPKAAWITKAHISSKKREASFTIDGSSGEFQCRLLSRGMKRPRFKECFSGAVTYAHLKPGRYTFEVRGFVLRPQKAIARWPFEIR